MAAPDEEEKMQEEIKDNCDETKEEQDMEEDDDDSSSDDEDENPRIKELRDSLSEKPYMYDNHLELIKLLRDAGELDQCREARENMNKSFPLASDLWLAWVKDEQKFMDTESASERENIRKLFERATRDYLSVEVWLEYCLFSMGGLSGGGEGDNASPEDRTREVFERALTAAGLHVSKGALLWTAYREYEMAVLAGLQPLPGSTATEEQQKAIDVETKRISKLFHRQLSVPHRDIENTFEEYQEWCEEVDPNTEKAYKTAVGKLELLEPFENKLETCTAEEQSAVYVEYLDEEMTKHKDPARIQCLFERAITDKCLESQIWTKYLLYLERDLHAMSSDIFSVYERGVRNVPWCTELWLGYVRAAERHQRSHHTVKAIFDRALAAGLYGANDVLQVWTALLDYLRRGIEWGEQDYEKDLEEFRTTFERAIHVLQTAYPNEQGLVVPLLKYAAWIEAKFCKNMEKARELLNESTKQMGSNEAQTWLHFIMMERAFGDRKHARKLFQRALNSVTDWPEGVVDAFINFEREEGTLDQYDQAVERCENQMKRINKRRAEMGRYSLSPKLSRNYHQLFSARFPPPKCTEYNGMEGNEGWTTGEKGKVVDEEKRRGRSGRQQQQPVKLTVDKCQRNVNNITLFFRKGTPLSNFYPCRFVDPRDKTAYSCSEQYYQAAKAKAFQDDDSYKIIMGTSDQVLMKRQGDKIKNFNKAVWRRNCRDVLLRACTLKFSQNDDLKAHLMNTRAVLAEASPTDCYWGIGRSLWAPQAGRQEQWRGENVMGEILMEVRKQLKQGCTAKVQEVQSATAAVKEEVQKVVQARGQNAARNKKGEVKAEDLSQKQAGTGKHTKTPRKINIRRPQPKENKERQADSDPEPVLELHPSLDDSFSSTPKNKTARAGERSKLAAKKQPAQISDVQSPDREIASPEREVVAGRKQQEVKLIRHDMEPEADTDGGSCKAAAAATHDIESPIYSPSQSPQAEVVHDTPVCVIQTEMQDDMEPGEIQSPLQDVQSPDSACGDTHLQAVKLIQTEMDLHTVPSNDQNRSSKGAMEKQMKPENDKEKLKKMAKHLGTKAVEEGEKAGTQSKLEADVLSQVLQGSAVPSDQRTVVGKGETGKLDAGSKRTVLLRRASTSHTEALKDEGKQTDMTGIHASDRETEEEKSTRIRRNKADFIRGAAGVFAKALKDVGKPESAKKAPMQLYEEDEVCLEGGTHMTKQKQNVAVDSERTVVGKSDDDSSHLQEFKTVTLSDKAPPFSAVTPVKKPPTGGSGYLFPITGQAVVASPGAPVYKCSPGGDSKGVKLPVYGTDKDVKAPEQAAVFPKRKIQRKWTAQKEQESPVKPDTLGGGDNGLTSKIVSEKKEELEQGEIIAKTDDDDFDEFIKARVESELVEVNEKQEGEDFVADELDSAANTSEKKKKKKHKKEKKHKKDKKKKKKKHHSDSDSSPDRKKHPVSDSEDTSPVKARRRYRSESDESPDKGRRYSEDSSPEKHRGRYSRRSVSQEKKRRRFEESPWPLPKTEVEENAAPLFGDKKREDMTEEELLIMLNMGQLEESPPPHRGGFRGRYQQWGRGRRPYRGGRGGGGRWINRGQRGGGQGGYRNYNATFKRMDSRGMKRSRSRSASRSRSRSYSRSRSRDRSSSSSRSRSSDTSPKKHVRRGRSSSSDRSRSGSSSNRSGSSSSDSDAGASKRSKKKSGNLPHAYRVTKGRARSRSRSWSYSKSRRDSKSRSRSREKTPSSPKERDGGKHTDAHHSREKHYSVRTPEQRKRSFDRPPSHSTGHFDNRRADFSPRFYTPQTYYDGGRGRGGARRMISYDPDHFTQVKTCERNIQHFTFFFRKGSPLSNFHICTFKDDAGQEFFCSEQYYQYRKAKILGDEDMAHQILRATDQAYIKQCGAAVRGYRENVFQWREKYARKVMKEALYLKFSQNPHLRDHLLRTNDIIAEANNRDNYFAIGVSMFSPQVTDRGQWQGENVLGDLLMDLKQQFRQEEEDDY